MGPPSEDDGENLGFVQHAKPTEWLQWGRRPKTTESPRSPPRCCACHCFNGAAVRRRRRGLLLIVLEIRGVGLAFASGWMLSAENG